MKNMIMCKGKIPIEDPVSKQRKRKSLEIKYYYIRKANRRTLPYKSNLNKERRIKQFELI